MFHTTFAIAKEAKACKKSYRAVAKALGGIKRYGRDTPIPLTRILDLRGLDDIFWCLAHVLPEETERRDREARLLACAYAEHGAHLWKAPAGCTWLPMDTTAVARRYAIGQATEDELRAARAAATAAWASAEASAGAAAWAARAAAWAARAAAWAAWAAAWAAWASAEAARASAWEAAWASAAASAGAARVAVEASAAASAGQAEREWQTTQLRAMLEG